MIALADEGFGSGEAVDLVLDRLDRRAGGDAAEHRQVDDARRGHGRIGGRALRRRRGGGAAALEIGVDQRRAETALSGRRDGIDPGAFRHAQDFQRAGPVRQASDEAALLQRRDQPVDAGFRPQIERFFHLVEGR